MKKVVVTCDSACDLSPALLERYDIVSIPMRIGIFGEKLKACTQVSAREVIVCVEGTGHLPECVMPTVQDYYEIFRQYSDLGFQVVHVGISGKISDCTQNAMEAAQLLNDVYVVDSLDVSVGAAELAVLGSELASAELDGPEIAEALNRMKKRLDTGFVLWDLDYLHHKKECSTARVLGNHIMKQHLCFHSENGVMAADGHVRGCEKLYLKEYVKMRLENQTNIQTDRVFLTHTGLPAHTLKELSDLILTYQPFDEILISEAGCFTVGFTGPRSLGLHYLRKQ